MPLVNHALCHWRLARQCGSAAAHTPTTHHAPPTTTPTPPQPSASRLRTQDSGPKPPPRPPSSFLLHPSSFLPPIATSVRNFADLPSFHLYTASSPPTIRADGGTNPCTTESPNSSPRPHSSPRQNPPPADIPPQLLDDILHDYHRPDRSLTELAAAHDLSIPQLLDILESPAVSQLLDRIARQSDLQAKRIAANAYPVAINRLFELAEVNPNHSRLLTPALDARARETTRKAAAQLVRIHRADALGKAAPPSLSPKQGDSPALPPRVPARPCNGARSCNRAPSRNAARTPSPTQTPPPPSVPLRLCVQSPPPPTPGSNRQAHIEKQPPAPGGLKPCRVAVDALPTSGP